MQRIDVGDQVAADAIGIYQFYNVRLPDRLLVHLVGAGHEEGVPIDIPAQRRMSDSQIGKNPVIEFVLAQKQFVNAGQKGAGFSSLNDAMKFGDRKSTRLNSSHT